MAVGDDSATVVRPDAGGAGLVWLLLSPRFRAVRNRAQRLARREVIEAA